MRWMESHRLAYALAAGVLTASLGQSEPSSPSLPTIADVNRDPVAVLRRVRGHFQSSSPVLRHRARRLGRLAAVAYLRDKAPKGLVLVTPMAWTFDGATIRPNDGLYLGRTEVTRAAMGHLKPAGQANHPVTDVNLHTARAFARRHGCRLPTLPELEHAATAGGLRRYPWGDRFDPARVHARESGAVGPTSVDALPTGAAACGALGLLGNVAEWTETSIGKRNTRFVVAGGSYRTYTRKRRFGGLRLSPAATAPDVGFRLARSLPVLPTDDRTSGGASSGSSNPKKSSSSSEADQPRKPADTPDTGGTRRDADGNTGGDASGNTRGE